MDGYDQIEREIAEIFYFDSKRRCDCCGKLLSFEDRGNHDSIFAWQAHFIEGWDAPLILCLGEPENCHLNCGHLGDYGHSAVFPEEHRQTIRGPEVGLRAVGGSADVVEE